MSGPLTWWANRKSRLGLSPTAIEPRRLHGKPWWTTPPIAPPQPEHIEFVVQYQRAMQAQPQTAARDALLGRIATWLKSARRLLHEQVESQRGDLHTTDGLICAAEQVVIQLMGKCLTSGVLTDKERERFEEVRQALQARAARIRRERVLNGATS